MFYNEPSMPLGFFVSAQLVKIQGGKKRANL